MYNEQLLLCGGSWKSIVLSREHIVRWVDVMCRVYFLFNRHERHQNSSPMVTRWGQQKKKEESIIVEHSIPIFFI